MRLHFYTSNQSVMWNCLKTFYCQFSFHILFLGNSLTLFNICVTDFIKNIYTKCHLLFITLCFSTNLKMRVLTKSWKEDPGFFQNAWKLFKSAITDDQTEWIPQINWKVPPERRLCVMNQKTSEKKAQFSVLGGGRKEKQIDSAGSGEQDLSPWGSDVA